MSFQYEDGRDGTHPNICRLDKKYLSTDIVRYIAMYTQDVLNTSRIYAQCYSVCIYILYIHSSVYTQHSNTNI